MSLAIYAAFVPASTYPGNLVLSIEALDEAVTLPTGTEVRIQVMMKTTAQTWVTVGLYPQALFCTADGSGLAHTALVLPLNMASFDVRVRARVNNPVGAYCAWSELNYVPAAAYPLAAPFGRTLTYKQVAEGLAKRRGFKTVDLMPVDAQADTAEFMTSAYRHCLETWPWPEATLAKQVTVASGLVTWQQICGADYFEFWTADPDNTLTCATAQRITLKSRDARGVHLCTTLESVWVKFTPRPPEFNAEALVVSERYRQGEVRYHPDSGNMYECIALNGALGGEIGDPAQWRSLPLLWLLSDATKLLALADWLGNTDQERGQAADLREQVERRLDALSLRETPNRTL